MNAFVGNIEVRICEKAGPQEGVCNWCGQLGGRRVGKGVIIITCAYPVRRKNSITDIRG